MSSRSELQDVAGRRKLALTGDQGARRHILIEGRRVPNRLRSCGATKHAIS
jgi:hypothetical protein